MTYSNIFLLLGTNLGDRLANIQNCIDLIGKNVGPIVRQSSVYESEAWGKTDEPPFLNQALQIESNLGPQDVLRSCLLIESKLGRVRQEKWGSRAIDIDVIYFDHQIIDSVNLKVPHPRIAERKFVLRPLAEISPDFRHPILQKTNATLLKECNDPLNVGIFAKPS